METSIVIRLHVVFGLDSLESSHRISIPVSHPDEIAEVFDFISYYKGQYFPSSSYLFFDVSFIKCLFIHTSNYLALFLQHTRSVYCADDGPLPHRGNV